MFSTRDLGTVCEEQPIAGNPKLKLRQLNLAVSYSTFDFFQDENAEPIVFAFLFSFLFIYLMSTKFSYIQFSIYSLSFTLYFVS